MSNEITSFTARRHGKEALWAGIAASMGFEFEEEETKVDEKKETKGARRYAFRAVPPLRRPPPLTMAAFPPLSNNPEQEIAQRLRQREKQIGFGKVTLEYIAYVERVPKADRRGALKNEPWTPDVHQDCSKKSFEGQVRKWRRILHQWHIETPDSAAGEARRSTPIGSPASSSSSSSSSSSPPPTPWSFSLPWDVVIAPLD